MADNLKSCPFCGGGDIYVGELDIDGPLEYGRVAYVRCLGCGAEVEGNGVDSDEEIRCFLARQAAVAAWNRRAGDE